MAKQFAIIVGWILIFVGILNLFVAPIKLWPAHAALHIIVGVLGVWSGKSPTASHKYAMWVGLVGVLLAIVGFAGVKDILGLFDLPPLFNVIHLVLGVWGSWAAFGGKKEGPAVNSTA